MEIAIELTILKSLGAMINYSPPLSPGLEVGHVEKGPELTIQRSTRPGLIESYHSWKYHLICGTVDRY